MAGGWSDVILRLASDNFAQTSHIAAECGSAHRQHRHLAFANGEHRLKEGVVAEARSGDFQSGRVDIVAN